VQQQLHDAEPGFRFGVQKAVFTHPVESSRQYVLQEFPQEVGQWQASIRGFTGGAVDG